MCCFKDAMQPNLVQDAGKTTPSFVQNGGPFANIAHGCNFGHRHDNRA